MVFLRILLKIILNALPIFLTTLGRTENFANFIYNSWSGFKIFVNVESFMLGCFILGLLGIYIYYPIRFEFLNRNMNRHKQRLKDLSKELLTIFSKNLGRELKQHNLQLNVRKFKKRPFYFKNFRYWGNRKKIYFQVQNYEYLTKEGKCENFSFQVSPIQRGLVGVAYAKKSIMYDDRLRERKEEFNLNNNHKALSVIANTDFAIVKPFIDKNDNVTSMIAFDTEQDVTIPQEKRSDIERLMLYYSDLFGKLLIKN